MLKQERHDAITKLCDERGTISVKEIVDVLGVSDMTVRRDLCELAEEGKLNRIRGGASSIADKSERKVPREFSHTEKRQLHKDEKQHIARIASGLISEGDTVFFGAGTTIELMVGFLPDVHLRVITNSLPVFKLLETRDDCDLCLVGGLYRPRTGAFVGPMAEEAVSVLGIDKAFIGANGILDHSISTSNMEEGKFQQLVYDKADARYLVADSSKVGKRDFYSFYDLLKLDAFITDPNLTPAQREAIGTYTQVLL